MKLPITIEYNSGESATFVAAPPEWVISQAQDKIGISDLVFLAYHAMKREAAGKPVKPIEAWTETISDVVVGEADPKVSQSEV
jgi:hypothetical protein